MSTTAVSLPASSSMHHPSLDTPAFAFWNRKEQLVGVICYLAISILALTVAPIPFAMGMAGCVISLTAVPAVSKFIFDHRLLSRRNYLAYILTDVLSGATLLGSAYMALRIAPLPLGVGAGWAFACTLTGFYAPLSLYHDFKAL